MEKTFNSFTAKTQFGLEDVLAEEIRKAGGKNIRVLRRAVSFDGDLDLLYKANLCLRTAVKILMPIGSFNARNEDALYMGIQRINWSKYMTTSDTLSIDGVVFSDYFNHSKYVALKCKDAIVDQFRKNTGIRPNVDIMNPDIKINIHISDDLCTVSLDSSGESLNRRGYRLEHNQAPLNENLAAGLILLTGWNGESNFTDFMCGSGTLLIEAAMIATNTPPNLRRSEFAFQKWKNYDENKFRLIIENLKNEIRPSKVTIQGSDVSARAMEITSENIKRSGIKGINFKLEQKSFTDAVPAGDPGIIVTNPPYDERMKEQDIAGFYKEIGNTLKKNFSGYDAWIISGNAEGTKSIGLKTSRKISLINGTIECKFLKFEMYMGSRKHPESKT
ncbi:MAG TPA: RNA methyltransferase [Bacteroidales bacterium]|nr:RNA methyltransferase [Bacteroidales bacterium]